MSFQAPTLRIGTRASALARWQAKHVAGALRDLPGVPAPELVPIKTEGDRIQDKPLSQLRGSAFFTKEIEAALLEGRVDVAVHSLKDLATEMPQGLTLGAVMEREDPRDALLLPPSGAAREMVSLPSDPPAVSALLPEGARVGTSSLRRRAFLARWRPDLKLLELRGNVPTRIEKMDRGEYDAIVLAAAGVKRLGLEERISAFLPLDLFLPAVSQGAVGVQIRSEDEDMAHWTGFLDHSPTRAATAAERALLRTVEGGCHAPVGAYATSGAAGREGQGDPSALKLRAVVCALDGSVSVEGELWGSFEKAEALGVRLARDLLSRGGEEILDEIRRTTGDR